MKFFILLLAFPILPLTACATQNAYDSLRYNRELECQEMQGQNGMIA
jgi:hypothetical protein